MFAAPQQSETFDIDFDIVLRILHTLFHLVSMKTIIEWSYHQPQVKKLGKHKVI